MSLQDSIIQSLKVTDCCTARDISYFLKFVVGVDAEPAQIRYGLQKLKSEGMVRKLKIWRRNIHYLSTKGKKEVLATLRGVEDDIIKNLRTRLLCHTRELVKHASGISNTGRDVAFCVLRHLATQGKVTEIFAVSYRGKIFRLYFHPDNKTTVEKRVDNAKKFVLSRRLVFTGRNTVRAMRAGDDFLPQEVTLSDISDFRNILYHLSYTGELNQIYFIEGHPFAVPGHATELRKMLEARG